MKKTFFIITILSFTLFACKNPLKPDPSKATASNFKVADSIPGTVAQNMITHYLDTTLVNHSLDAIVKQVSLYNSDLYGIFDKLSTKSHPVTRLRLLMAAYLDTDSIIARRNQVTVLLQVKQNYSSNYYYYDVQSFGDARLCPPPMGCSTEQ
jgi:hypothetical protein